MNEADFSTNTCYDFTNFELKLVNRIITLTFQDNHCSLRNSETRRIIDCGKLEIDTDTDIATFSPTRMTVWLFSNRGINTHQQTQKFFKQRSASLNLHFKKLHHSRISSQAKPKLFQSICVSV